MATEKLLDVEIPPRATWIRMLMCELNRMASFHLQQLQLLVKAELNLADAFQFYDRPVGYKAHGQPTPTGEVNALYLYDVGAPNGQGTKRSAVIVGRFA